MRFLLTHKHGVAVVALALLPLSVGAEQPFFLRSGDRVVFYGDSITEQAFYTNIVETYALTRYPSLAATFTNSGWSGDTVTGGGGGPIDTRIARDILPYRPDVVTIMLGMNDGHYRAATEPDERQYFDGYRHIVSVLKADLPGARITMIAPSPYDDITRPPSFPGGYAAVIAGFAQWVAEQAPAEGCSYADMNGPVNEMLARARDQDPVLAREIIPDRVHPSFAGHMIMAEQLLKAWHARSLVSAVTLDAGGPKPTLLAAEHATVTGLSASGGVGWSQLDDALPLPVPQWKQSDHDDPLISLVLASSDFMDALDRQMLRVHGLPAPVYTLRIDGQQVAVLSRAQLEQGVNLATMATPMTAQAASVFDLTAAHNGFHYERWRRIQLALTDAPLPGREAAMRDLDALDQEAVAEQRRRAAPVAHHMELVPLS